MLLDCPGILGRMLLPVVSKGLFILSRVILSVFLL